MEVASFPSLSAQLYAQLTQPGWTRLGNRRGFAPKFLSISLAYRWVMNLENFATVHLSASAIHSWGRRQTLALPSLLGSVMRRWGQEICKSATSKRARRPPSNPGRTRVVWGPKDCSAELFARFLRLN